jgi:hypothetical protein
LDDIRNQKSPYLFAKRVIPPFEEVGRDFINDVVIFVELLIFGHQMIDRRSKLLA